MILTTILSLLLSVTPSQIVSSEMTRCPDATYLDFREGKKLWNYASGLEMKAFLDVYETTGNEAIFNYVESWYDMMIDDEGNPYRYKLTSYNIDNICPGRTLITLYQKTRKEKYLKTLELLHKQLESQPRTKEGGYWHKAIYPNQIWLDGLYMGEPFLVEYAKYLGYDQMFDAACEESIHQFLTAASVTYDSATGLHRHAYDSSREMFWCDPVTGQSEHCWARALGWYCIAAVDVLENIPYDTKGRGELIKVLQRIINNIPRYADPKTGMWYQVMDQPGREGNYLEATASAMFTYAILKGVRIGVLDSSLLDYGKQCWKSLLKTFVTIDKAGLVNLNNCCTVGGLGGGDNRKGDFTYYISEPIKSNDPKGIGPFIWAALEMERLEPGVSIRVSNYRYGKPSATSFTFDDGNRDNYVLAVPELERRGWRGTFWLNCSRIPGEVKGVAHLMNWDEIRDLHSRGHEISNHGWDHKKLTKIPYEEAVAEIEKNDSAIFANIGVKPTTFCYAHNSRNTEIIKMVSKGRVGSRTSEFGFGGQSTDQQLRQRMNDAIQNGKWAVWMTHGLTHGYDHFKDLSRFASFLDYVKEHESDIWVGTFRDVAAYVAERDAVKLSIEKSKHQFKIKPSLVLDPSLFNMPLTMTVKGVKKFKVTQDNSKLSVVYHKDYATFEFNPYGGEILIKY